MDQAQWGPDGYIYFIRKGTQLWRVKPGNPPEAVYKATGFARGGRTSYGNELVFNADRTCLAFCYRVPIHEMERNKYGFQNSLYGTVRCGVVIIDLKENEYLHIPASRFYNIYRDLDSKGLLNLCNDTFLTLSLNRHIWHIENMDLIVDE